MPRAAKKAAVPPPTPASDPLADLRDDGDAETRYPAPPSQEGAQEPPEAPGEGDPLTAVILERLEAAMALPLDPDGILAGAPDKEAATRQALGVMAADLADNLRPTLAPPDALTPREAVERWHADTVAVGILHRGGRCGCTYLAQTILGA